MGKARSHLSGLGWIGRYNRNPSITELVSMTTIETAVLLQQSLLENAEAIARAMNVSRDQVLEMALTEFVQQYQKRQSLSLDMINEAYADALDLDDQRLLKGMHRLHRQVLENND